VLTLIGEALGTRRVPSWLFFLWSRSEALITLKALSGLLVMDCPNCCDMKALTLFPVA
jgi:hypothetical protein